MAGGGKGGLWKAQRVPTEPWHMGQYGYNQVTEICLISHPPYVHARQRDRYIVLQSEHSELQTFSTTEAI